MPIPSQLDIATVQDILVNRLDSYTETYLDIGSNAVNVRGKIQSYTPEHLSGRLYYMQEIGMNFKKYRAEDVAAFICLHEAGAFEGDIILDKFNYFQTSFSSAMLEHNPQYNVRWNGEQSAHVIVELRNAYNAQKQVFGEDIAKESKRWQQKVEREEKRKERKRGYEIIGVDDEAAGFSDSHHKKHECCIVL